MVESSCNDFSFCSILAPSLEKNFFKELEMTMQNIESVKIALQNARDNARALRLSGAPESVQDEAYELVYQLRTLLDDLTLAENAIDKILSIKNWAFITIVNVHGFNFEFKNDNACHVINDNGMIHTSNVIKNHLINLSKGV